MDHEPPRLRLDRPQGLPARPSAGPGTPPSRSGGAFPGANIIEGAGTDYRFRAAIPEAEVVGVISRELLDIDYANHKAATKDDELHSAYSAVWSIMARLQDDKPHP